MNVNWKVCKKKLFLRSCGGFVGIGLQGTEIDNGKPDRDDGTRTRDFAVSVIIRYTKTWNRECRTKQIAGLSEQGCHRPDVCFTVFLMSCFRGLFD
jgi:hypothetical protein